MHSLQKVLASFDHCLCWSLGFIIELGELVKERACLAHSTKRVYLSANLESAMIHSALYSSFTKLYVLE